MVNNEIRRLLSCLVAASKENGTSLEEIQEALKQAYQEETELVNLITEESFRDKAKRFVLNELNYHQLRLGPDQIVNMLCIYNEINPDRIQMSDKRYMSELVKRFNITNNCAYGICLSIRIILNDYLMKRKPKSRHQCKRVSHYLNVVMPDIEDY